MYFPHINIYLQFYQSTNLLRLQKYVNEIVIREAVQKDRTSSMNKFNQFFNRDSHRTTSK